MALVKKESLLSDARVVDEINRHRWIESEKAGSDIGFEKASTDWLDRFSEAWLSNAKANNARTYNDKVSNGKSSAKRFAKTV